MRLVRSVVFWGVLLASFPALAQEEMSLYSVSDVAVDITASSAAAARDEAIIKAQHQAFDQLMGRLGAHSVPLSDDDLTLTVRSFEVQKEHASPQRYTGTFTVEFKPDAVKQILEKGGVSYTEERAQPLVVLPIAMLKDRPVLWDDRTIWRNAWEETARKAVLVPMIVPSGDLDDIAKISVQEALDGKAESLKALAQKYKAGGVLVVILEPKTPVEEAQIEAQAVAYAYDAEGEKKETFALSLSPGENFKSLDDEMKDGVMQIVNRVEGEWRTAHAPAPATPLTASAPGAIVPPATPGAPVFLPVDVPVASLAIWGQIRNKLSHTPSVLATHVVTMTRGLVHIELQFQGDMAALQTGLNTAGLQLEQELDGSWQIRQATP